MPDNDAFYEQFGQWDLRDPKYPDKSPAPDFMVFVDPPEDPADWGGDKDRHASAGADNVDPHLLEYPSAALSNGEYPQATRPDGPYFDATLEGWRRVSLLDDAVARDWLVGNFGALSPYGRDLAPPPPAAAGPAVPDAAYADWAGALLDVAPEKWPAYLETLTFRDRPDLQQQPGEARPQMPAAPTVDEAAPAADAGVTVASPGTFGQPGAGEQPGSVGMSSRGVSGPFTPIGADAPFSPIPGLRRSDPIGSAWEAFVAAVGVKTTTGEERPAGSQAPHDETAAEYAKETIQQRAITPRTTWEIMSSPQAREEAAAPNRKEPGAPPPPVSLNRILSDEQWWRETRGDEALPSARALSGIRRSEDPWGQSQYLESIADHRSFGERVAGVAKTAGTLAARAGREAIMAPVSAVRLGDTALTAIGQLGANAYSWITDTPPRKVPLLLDPVWNYQDRAREITEQYLYQPQGPLEEAAANIFELLAALRSGGRRTKPDSRAAPASPEGTVPAAPHSPGAPQAPTPASPGMPAVRQGPTTQSRVIYGGTLVPKSFHTPDHVGYALPYPRQYDLTKPSPHGAAPLDGRYVPPPGKPYIPGNPDNYATRINAAGARQIDFAVVDGNYVSKMQATLQAAKDPAYAGAQAVAAPLRVRLGEHAYVPGQPQPGMPLHDPNNPLHGQGGYGSLHGNFRHMADFRKYKIQDFDDYAAFVGNRIDEINWDPVRKSYIFVRIENINGKDTAFQLTAMLQPDGFGGMEYSAGTAIIERAAAQPRAGGSRAKARYLTLFTK